MITNTVNNFRKDCLRELKKIKIAWPDLHYKTAKGVLIVSPRRAHDGGGDAEAWTDRAALSASHRR